MNDAAPAISTLAPALGERMRMRCLYAAVAKYQAASRKMKVWQLPESSLYVFAIEVILGGSSVEDAIARQQSKFDALRYRTDRQVYRWVDGLNERYTEEIHRVTRKMVDELEDIPEDGNATSKHLAVIDRLQTITLRAFDADTDLDQLDSKTLNARNKFLDSISRAMEACAKVALSDARIQQIASRFSETIEKAGGLPAGVTEESIAEMIHEALMGKGGAS